MRGSAQACGPTVTAPTVTVASASPEGAHEFDFVVELVAMPRDQLALRGEIPRERPDGR